MLAADLRADCDGVEDDFFFARTRGRNRDDVSEQLRRVFDVEFVFSKFGKVHLRKKMICSVNRNIKNFKFHGNEGHHSKKFVRFHRDLNSDRKIQSLEC
jgi:hypothetical protein